MPSQGILAGKITETFTANILIVGPSKMASCGIVSIVQKPESFRGQSSITHQTLTSVLKYTESSRLHTLDIFSPHQLHTSQGHVDDTGKQIFAYLGL